jgi:hypothetical protein
LRLCGDVSTYAHEHQLQDQDTLYLRVEYGLLTRDRSPRGIRILGHKDVLHADLGDSNEDAAGTRGSLRAGGIEGDLLHAKGSLLYPDMSAGFEEYMPKALRRSPLTR